MERRLDPHKLYLTCDRCTYARSSAIILCDFCQSLRIPVMACENATSYHKVEPYSYAEFESMDQDDRYRMIYISAAAVIGTGLRCAMQQSD